MDDIGRGADELAHEHPAADDAGRGARDGGEGLTQLSARHVQALGDIADQRWFSYRWLEDPLCKRFNKLIQLNLFIAGQRDGGPDAVLRAARPDHAEGAQWLAAAIFARHCRCRQGPVPLFLSPRRRERALRGTAAQHVSPKLRHGRNCHQ